MPTTRQQRIQELLVHEISDILRREVNDPRIGFVTVTGAQVSPDLRHARVFVSVLGTDEERAAALQGLASARRFVRAEFARRARLRAVPEIRFEVDTAIEHGARIHKLLAGLQREEEEDAEDPGGGSGDPLRD